MGCYCSKRPTNATSGSAAAVSAAGSYIQFTPELSSYLNACRSDPDILSFDTFLHQRTHLSISNLSSNIHLRSLSLPTLKEVTACLIEINQQVSRIILGYRKEIWKHPELSDLVQDYFDKGLHTLQLCSALRNCLNNFQNSQLILRLALQRFDEADPSLTKYQKTIDELRSFKESGDPFTEEFFRVFQLICQQQLSMLEKLRLKRKKLDEKLRSVGAWMKLSCIIFASGFTVLLICSVVADIVTGPPVAASVSAACAASVGSIGKWFDISMWWSDYWEEINGEDMMVGAAKVGAFSVVNDMDEILVMVNLLEDQISSLVENSEFCFRDEAAVRFGIGEIRNKMGFFMKSVEDLTVQADQCRGDLGRARIGVLQRIIEHPE